MSGHRAAVRDVGSTDSGCAPMLLSQTRGGCCQQKRKLFRVLGSAHSAAGRPRPAPPRRRRHRPGVDVACRSAIDTGFTVRALSSRSASSSTTAAQVSSRSVPRRQVLPRAPGRRHHHIHTLCGKAVNLGRCWDVCHNMKAAGCEQGVCQCCSSPSSKDSHMLVLSAGAGRGRVRAPSTTARISP